MKPEIPAQLDPNEELSPTRLAAAIDWLSDRALREAIRAERVRSRPKPAAQRGARTLTPRGFVEDAARLPSCPAPGCDLPALADNGGCGQRGHWRTGQPRPPGVYYNLGKTPAAKAGKLSLVRAAHELGVDRTMLRRRIEAGDIDADRDVNGYFFIAPAEVERVKRDFKCRTPGCDGVTLGDDGYCGARGRAKASDCPNAGGAALKGKGRTEEDKKKISDGKRERPTRAALPSELTFLEAAGMAGMSREPFRALVRGGVLQGREFPWGSGFTYAFDRSGFEEKLAALQCAAPRCVRLARRPNGYCGLHEHHGTIRARILRAGLLDARQASAQAHFSPAAIMRAEREGRLPSVDGFLWKAYRPADVATYARQRPSPPVRARTGGVFLCEGCGENERYLAPSQIDRWGGLCLDCRLDELKDPRHWVPLVELARVHRGARVLTDSEARAIAVDRAESRLRSLGVIRRGQPRKRRLSPRDLRWLRRYRELRETRDRLMALELQYDPKFAEEWEEVGSDRAIARTIAAAEGVAANAVRVSIQRALARAQTAGTRIR